MRLSWLPFALLLVILPYPGTVAARLLLLLISFFVAATWHFRAEPAMRAVLPCKPALVLWWVVSFASLSYAVDPAYSLGELKNELGYALLALSAFFVVGQRRDTALFALRALAGGVAILCGWATATWIGEGFGWNRMGGHGDIGIVATYVVTVLPPCSGSWPTILRLPGGVRGGGWLPLRCSSPRLRSSARRGWPSGLRRR